MADRHIDTSGYACPIPILKTRKALNEMPPGALLEVVATDPAAPADMIAFCKASGNTLVESGQSGAANRGFRFVIRRDA